MAEDLKVKVVRRRGGPQAERVDGLAAVPHHGTIERDADQARRPAGDGVQGPAVHLERTVELHLHSLMWPRDLPGVWVTQPVVRLFLLPAVLDRLLEDAVLVPQTIAHRRKLHGRHRVEKTGRQTPEPPIPQAGVWFLFDEAQPVEVLLRDRLLHHGIEPEIHDIVGQRAADEKLHGEIVHALGVLARVCILGQDPALREDIPHRASEGLKTLTRAGIGQFDDVVEEEMPLVERVVRAYEFDWAAAILPEELRYAIGSR